MNFFLKTALIVGALFLGISSVFTVTEVEQALVLQLGEHKKTIREPGLYFKLPFVQNVIFLDKRILNLDVPSQEIIASDQKRLVVDAIARFKIIDPLLTYQTRGNEANAAQALATLLSSNLREVLGREEFITLLSGERANLMTRIRDGVNLGAATFGIEIVDVRIRRADLPEANSQAIYTRMNTEREREARETRAEGGEQALRIRAEAERERTILLAEAERDSQILRGEGDSEAVRIFAESFGRDIEFFEFYRTMQAYRKALNNDDTTLVLSPNSEFFKFLDSMYGNKK
ncbi:MAG: protease modulator HflC [Alphaproteobacteria bacterium]|nr:MAG: protease modulator HflC [Alphaproteobacteria bacterium]